MSEREVHGTGNGKPVAWARTKDGEIDWSDDCLGQSKYDIFEDADAEHGYGAIPLYAHPSPVASNGCEDALRGLLEAIDDPKKGATFLDREGVRMNSYSDGENLEEHCGLETAVQKARTALAQPRPLSGRSEAAGEAQPPLKHIKVRAWITDEEFGYDHWRAAEYSCGKGTHHATLIVGAPLVAFTDSTSTAAQPKEK